MSHTPRKVQFILFAILAACAGGSLPSNGPHLTVPFRHSQSPSSLPPELLYVAGGPTSEPNPFIEVFNAQDTSPTPQPLYTIAPTGGGSYGLFAVDATNDLFAVNYFANGAKLLVFPSGATKPTVNCLVDTSPQGMYIANSVLYFTTALYTIEEYSLPIHTGGKCPNPTRVLTDQRAKLRGTGGFWGPAVDPSGDVFDLWASPGFVGERIDEFPAGLKNARHFAPLARDPLASFITSDSSGNLITSASGIHYDSIAMFPHGSHIPKYFHTIRGRNSVYFGFAIGHRGTELFATTNYPYTKVQVYAYNSRTGNVGRVLRSFTDVWSYASSVAVFSRK
jgi:hypothetical protein